ncbi:glycine zipper 2TM domain-containing protein [Marinobacter sp. F3R11]|uniref:glycine zipper 2TM domain-containing protein n=1 Tax=Marinobacter sp. F3R11 TaxID=2267231 RepID=UPI000DE9DBB1|nr:glycine zipper family protein [Marinobacter sp. F3R11]
MLIHRKTFKWFMALFGTSMVPVWVGVIMLAGCAAPRASVQSIPPSVDTAEVVAYPLHGQSERQVRQDRYECYLWAVRQSGYDPAAQTDTAEAVPEVVPEPAAGAATVAGTVTGATVGALASGPRHQGAGVVIGAVVGALAGASVDADQQARAEAAQSRYAASVVEAENRRIESYRRALSACLDARGYSVR